MMRDYILLNATVDETDARILPTVAYSDLGSIDEAGNLNTPPTIAAGTWHIYSDDTIPVDLAPFVQASGNRNVGLKLPIGIAGLSTVWAGMTFLP